MRHPVIPQAPAEVTHGQASKGDMTPRSPEEVFPGPPPRHLETPGSSAHEGPSLATTENHSAGSLAEVQPGCSGQASRLPFLRKPPVPAFPDSRLLDPSSCVAYTSTQRGRQGHPPLLWNLQETREMKRDFQEDFSAAPSQPLEMPKTRLIPGQARSPFMHFVTQESRDQKQNKGSQSP